MSMTVREVLDLPAVRAASPSLTTRPAGLNRVVTWAHSSEIFEIGPLLSGGELLLTTGLGIGGADPGARRYWIRDLAQRKVAAVAIEIGRSLPTLPEELIDEADRCELALIRLDQVVPFERICRAVNTVLLDQESTELRLADQLSGQLFTALTRGGLAAVARAAAEHTGCAVAVSTASGQIVAVGGVPSTRSLARLADEAAARVSLLIDGRPWGEVLVGPHREWTPKALDAAARRIAAAAAVAITHLGDSTGESGTGAIALLDDLLTGSAVSEHELVVRAGLVGLHPPAGGVLMGVAAHAADPVATTAAIRAAGTRLGGALTGRVRGQVLALVAASGHQADPAGELVTMLRADPSDELGCVVGPPVPPPEAGRSLREAHAAAEIARPGIWTWRQTVPDRLLGMLDDAGRQHLIDDLLGPLKRWDSAHGSDLVRTVDTYLRHGCNSTRTADVLHVRRQSLHQRLRRAEQLLGHPVDDPSVVTALLLATHAARPGAG